MSAAAARLRSTKAVGPKILVIDIERRTGLARIWDQKTRFVPISNFERFPSLLCFAAKWVGSNRMEFYSAWAGDNMAQASWDLYHKADAVVTFNGKRFDNKHLRSEWVVAGMPPPSPWKDIDLFQIAASQFGFESKSLNHLCQRLDLDQKAGHYDALMAERCLDGDEKAQRIMRRYNGGDVKITEQAYHRLLPWIHNHPHLGPDASESPSCNKCLDGGDVHRDGTYLANQIRYVQYRCHKCNGWVRGARHSRAAVTIGVK